MGLMPTWKPGYRRNKYLRVHFYGSIVLSAVLFGVAVFLLTVSKNAVPGLWAFALGVILLGSMPGILVADADEKKMA
jgi:hypothetical protein